MIAADEDQADVPITKALRASLRAELRRTGVTAIRLLHDARDLPAGLTARSLNRWLTGLAPSAPRAHLDYVQARWAKLSLITDGAFYDAEGRVQHIASKVAVSQPHRLAIAVAGRVAAAEVVRALGDAQHQGEALRRLPAAAKAIRASNASANPAGELERMNKLQLFVAMWSDATDRPEGWIISTDQAYFGADYLPGTLIEVGQVSSPPVQLTLDPRRFDPVRDGRRVILEQRRARHEAGHYQVGGFAEATIVERGGVRKERIVTWPDRVGERIAA